MPRFVVPCGLDASSLVGELPDDVLSVRWRWMVGAVAVLA
jgi:hypothetical protein